jgi:mono/diheme cytochrome c family protein
MVMRGMLVLTLAALPAACGSGKAAQGSRVVPEAYAAESSAATAVAGTGGAAHTAGVADSLRENHLPEASADSQRRMSAPGRTGTGRTGGRGMMGGRGTMGGRMGTMMGGSGGQAPAAAAQAAADTGTCPQITQAVVDAGRQIFTGRGNCATCHGANGKGGPLAPNLTDTTWLDTNGSYAGIAGLVKSGVPQPKQHPAPMPPTGGANLSAIQVCAVAGYVYSLSHKQ